MDKQRTQWRAGHASTLAAVATAVGIGLVARAAIANDPTTGVGSDRPFVASASSRTQPLANTSVGNARVVVPDGSSVMQVVTNNPETHWFAIPVEQGKSYVLEVMNVEGDLSANAIQAVNLFNSDGASPPTEVQFDCTQSAIAPSLEISASADGARCTIRTFLPGPATTVGKRGVFAKIDTNFGPSYQVRVRESTIYGRWTSNGYQFHTEIQNATADPICVQIVFLPDTGSTPPSGPANVVFAEVVAPPHGAIKPTPLASGASSGGALKGDLRILGCANGAKNFVPGAVHVSSYAFNPVTNQYLYFFTWAANNGVTANSW